MGMTIAHNDYMRACAETSAYFVQVRRASRGVPSGASICEDVGKFIGAVEAVVTSRGTVVESHPPPHKNVTASLPTRKVRRRGVRAVPYTA